jgi:Undecaprenyl-phosphate glucose phosphotransferase
MPASSFARVATLDVASSRSSGAFLKGIPYHRIGPYTAVSDFILILIVSVATGITYSYFAFASEGNLGAFLAVGSYSGMMFVLWANARGLYRPKAVLATKTQFRGVILAWCGVLLFVTSLLFLLKVGASYSRGATISFGLIGLVSLLTSRAFIGASLRKASANGTLRGQRAIVIGESEELAAQSARHLLQTYGAREVGRFDLSSGESIVPRMEPEPSVIESAISAAKANDAEIVLLALKWSNEARTSSICEHLRSLPLPVLLLPDGYAGTILSKAPWAFNRSTAVEIQRAPLSSKDLIAKRTFDVVLAVLGLAAFCLPALLICLAIKFDSAGPVLFLQRRKGFNGRNFAIYKFRTMTVLEDGSKISQARPSDPRVTRFGRFLRMTSIDEVPQLINVIRGEMSLVGPRPHAVAHDDEYGAAIKEYAFRHHVKPGLTGWAQIHGYRGSTANVALMKKRVEHDLWYINNWSLWLDIQIALRTIFEVVRRRNAY